MSRGIQRNHEPCSESPGQQSNSAVSVLLLIHRKRISSDLTGKSLKRSLSLPLLHTEDHHRDDSTMSFWVRFFPLCNGFCKLGSGNCLISAVFRSMVNLVKLFIFRRLTIMRSLLPKSNEVEQFIVQNQQFAPTTIDLNQENESSILFSIINYWVLNNKMLTLQAKGKDIKEKVWEKDNKDGS